MYHLALATLRNASGNKIGFGKALKSQGNAIKNIVLFESKILFFMPVFLKMMK